MHKLLGKSCSKLAGMKLSKLILALINGLPPIVHIRGSFKTSR